MSKSIEVRKNNENFTLTIYIKTKQLKSSQETSTMKKKGTTDIKTSNHHNEQMRKERS